MSEETAAVEDDVLERGRYVFYNVDGTPTGFRVARATNLCETCLDCGCGDQQEILSAKVMLAEMMKMGPGRMLAGVKEMMRRGN